MKQRNLNGFTLTELLIVLAIIGILVMLILPNQTAIITKAKTKEAELHLKNAYNLQQYYYNIHSKYSNNLKEIDFIQEKLITDGGKANYRLEIIESSESGYKIRATSVVDFNQNGVYNVWEIDQNQNLNEVTKD